MLTKDELQQRTDMFVFDSSDDSERTWLAQDFADWLRDNGRERDAHEFLVKVKSYLLSTQEPSLDEVIRIANSYGDVLDLDEVYESDSDLEELLQEAQQGWSLEREMEDRLDRDTPIQSLNQGEPEFPDVVVPLLRSDTVDDLAVRVIFTMMREGHVRGARVFTSEANFFIARHDAETLLELILEYVTVVPDIVSQSWRA